MNFKTLITSELRLGMQIERAERPRSVLLVAHIIPELCRMTMFLLFAVLAGGRAAVPIAIVGIAVVAMYRAALSEVTDIPVRDSMFHVTGPLLAGGAVALLRYSVRCAPLLLLAVVDSVLAVCILAPALGETELLFDVLRCWWVTVPVLASSLMCGLTIASFAIGNTFQNLIHNAMASLAVVCSGAFFLLDSFPVLKAIGSVLPGQHSIAGLRALIVGESAALHVLLECVVACGWAIVGIGLYSIVIRRARRHGRGVFGN
ncbi:hypothetical protein [Corynebacterium mustelae]|nr:hypothetical protein [Corynebacterium mustelae]